MCYYVCDICASLAALILGSLPAEFGANLHTARKSATEETVSDSGMIEARDQREMEQDDDAEDMASSQVSSTHFAPSLPSVCGHILTACSGLGVTG